jgi:hypothetical protein
MRLYNGALLALGALAVVGGCTPATPDPQDEGLITAVAGIVESGPALASASTGDDSSDAPTRFQGSLVSGDDYRLVELGPAAAGEQWTVANLNARLVGDAFLVVLLDSDYDLLRRQVIAGGTSLAHIVRADTATLYLGVASAYGTDGGDFRLEVGGRAGAAIPNPQAQVVWLNFGGAADLRVHARDAISFEPFDAASLGSAYAGATEVVKAAIVATVQEDYGRYNVTVLTSDDGPPPDGPYATVHFGSYDAQLLGLADNVDQYNADPWQNAIIYVDDFADFAVMGLSDEEMGQMVGNVASHEFGHLLGLFHTQIPADLMDTTGTAWDLADDQAFTRARLEPSVFPIGFEDSPARLAETIGVVAAPEEGRLAKPLGAERMVRKAAVRRLAKDVLRGRCGTCLELDR